MLSCKSLLLTWPSSSAGQMVQTTGHQRGVIRTGAVTLEHPGKISLRCLVTLFFFFKMFGNFILFPRCLNFCGFEALAGSLGPITWAGEGSWVSNLAAEKAYGPIPSTSCQGHKNGGKQNLLYFRGLILAHAWDCNHWLESRDTWVCCVTGIGLKPQSLMGHLARVHAVKPLAVDGPWPRGGLHSLYTDGERARERESRETLSDVRLPRLGQLLRVTGTKL